MYSPRAWPNPSHGASECDPAPIPEEKHKSALLVDFAPDHGVANWPAQ